MGIYIGMYLNPHRITQAKWEAVYEEALLLAKKLGLHDGIVDQDSTARELDLGDGTIGFYIHRMGTKIQSRVETICIRRNLNYYLEQAGPDGESDILFAPLSGIMEGDGFDCRSGTVTVFWSKTLNREIHIAILALACLFADRLPDAVALGCDIDLNQCQEAVELANHYLKNRIETPVVCRVGKLMERLAALNIPREKQLCVFMDLYLGELSEKVKEHLMRSFPAEEIEWHCRHREPRSNQIFLHVV